MAKDDPRNQPGLPCQALEHEGDGLTVSVALIPFIAADGHIIPPHKWAVCADCREKQAEATGG